ncbi:MAG: DNA primase [Pseudomonadales bacterium]|nr:DNA primase [Pseudomonadales bacterium]
MIPQEFIDEVLSRTDIVEVIESRVDLKKAGRNYTGLCPFHKEKSPSFSVNREKQFYYCFGCQASGTVIKFLQEYDRMEFISAMEYLAARLGMEVPQQGGSQTPEHHRRQKSIYQLLEQAADFYRLQLRQHSARDRAVDYLKGRGLTGEIARDYGLGYAPPGWDNLYKALAKTNHEKDLLVESGMVIEQEEGDKTYDRFRDRIMFPIRDIRGRVIAFGGRILGDGKPKYLNSPETTVFHKGRELYGLHEARKHNRKLSQLLIVEGYMDVVALGQSGISYAVATLGTATSSDHIERMYRLVSRLVFCFDGDQAGRNAAWKALNVVLPHLRDGRSARFLFLPDGEDPDTLVRKEGKEKFELRIDRAQTTPEFFFARLSVDYDLASMEGKAALSHDAMPMIDTIPRGVFRELMIDELARLTGLSNEKLVGIAANSPPMFRTPMEPPPVAADVPPWTDEGYDDSYLTDDGYDMPQDLPQVPAEVARLTQAAISMLMRQPELADIFEASVYSRLQTIPGCRFLLDLIHSIQAEEISSPVMLLDRWQDSPQFSWLQSMLEQEQLLDVSELPSEYRGVIESLLAQLDALSVKELRGDLLSKPFSELSDAEKELLRTLVHKNR